MDNKERINRIHNNYTSVVREVTCLYLDKIIDTARKQPDRKERPRALLREIEYWIEQANITDRFFTDVACVVPEDK